MIELEFLLEIEFPEDRLLVCPLELIFPFDIRLARLEIHPHEAHLVDVDVDWQQAVLALIEALHRLEARRFREVPLVSIRPAMVLAAQHLGCA